MRKEGETGEGWPTSASTTTTSSATSATTTSTTTISSIAYFFTGRASRHELRFLHTKIGNIVWTHSLVCYKKWMKVPSSKKRTLRNKLLVLFVVDLSHPKIIEYVDKKMAKLYSVFRHQLYKYNLSCGTPARGRANLPNDVYTTHWDWLCNNVYTTTHFLEETEVSYKGEARRFIQHARTAHKDNMKKMKDEMREKLIQEAPKGTPSDSIHVPLDDEFGIMAENLGRKGKSVNGVGVFPHTDTSGFISSMASSSELTDIRPQIKLLSDAQLDLCNDEENLFTKIKAFIAASQEKTNNFTESEGDISKGENTYTELEEHDLEEEWCPYCVFCG
ncbi:hypothetical protein D8674_034941 [Pyrus ussuriensis x Pyrus communis]|uniref:Uncharacterized protein n=1 Tax=Pyrus ussuriensis x Pyrus communis TaxID=2448454 RepID=A0A5N5GB06_9ROSA|nr:hypothetical protein D8674_034941 [Pyrus ussuriensis x Pyrus communis]